MKIKVKYFDSEMPKLEKIQIGDWIDLRTSKEVWLNTNEFKIIPLGVAIELPEGYEAHVVPRSSTFKNFKVIQTNHMGVIDESYCGNDDQWFMPVLAIHETKIPKYSRICQFRIMKKMPEIEIEEVTELNNKNRNGYGSTGIE